jgi:hypothetical protein
MVNYCFALPYTQGGLELAKKFAKENTNTKEHDEFYKLSDISREPWLKDFYIFGELFFLKTEK